MKKNLISFLTVVVALLFFAVDGQAQDAARSDQRKVEIENTIKASSANAYMFRVANTALSTLSTELTADLGTNNFFYEIQGNNSVFLVITEGNTYAEDHLRDRLTSAGYAGTTVYKLR